MDYIRAIGNRSANLQAIEVPKPANQNTLFATHGAHLESPEIELPSILYLGLILLASKFCERLLIKLTQISESAYESPFLFLQIGNSSPWLHSIVLLGIGALCLSLLHSTVRKRLFFSWSIAGNKLPIRWLIVMAAFPLAWRLVTHDHNYYWNHSYGIDRLLIAFLFTILIFRPIAVAPLLLVSLPLLFQFQYPLLGATWSTASLSVRIQIFFLTYLLIRITANHRLKDERILVLGILTIIAFHYWPSGWLKLKSGWLIHNQIHVLLSATTAAGWLNSIGQEQIDRFVRAAAKFDFLLRFGALIIELSPLFILWGRRKTPMLILPLLIALHLGVVLMTGIFFWEWIVIEASLMTAFLWGRNKSVPWPTLRPAAKLASSLLIVSSIWWYRAPSLFWFDAAASYSYEFQAIDNHGSIHQLPQNFFEPISYEIRVQNIAYMADNTPLLGITFGATNRETSDSLQRTKSVADLLELERKMGSLETNEQMKTRFRTFVNRFATNYNQHPEHKHTWRGISAPYCILEDWGKDTGNLPINISRVDIYQRFTFFDGTKTHVARRKRIAEIEIPSSPISE